MVWYPAYTYAFSWHHVLVRPSAVDDGVDVASRTKSTLASHVPLAALLPTLKTTFQRGSKLMCIPALLLGAKSRDSAEQALHGCSPLTLTTLADSQVYERV
jgi:hypothetical protein